MLHIDRIELIYVLTFGLSAQWICLLCCVVEVLIVSAEEINKVANCYRSFLKFVSSYLPDLTSLGP